MLISVSTAGSKVTWLLSHWKLKGTSSSRRFGLVLLMFLSVGSLSMTKPRYKLMETSLFLTCATGARFWRLSRCGGVYPSEWQPPVRIMFHSRPSSCQPPPTSSVAVARRRLDPRTAESSSLEDELVSSSSFGKSIIGTGHVIWSSLRTLQSCSSNRVSTCHLTAFFTRLVRANVVDLWSLCLSVVFVICVITTKISSFSNSITL